MTNNYFIKYLLVFGVLLLNTIGLAQVTITYPPGNPQCVDERRPLGVFNGYERSQLVYEVGSSELNIPPGSIITHIAFFLHTINVPPGLAYDYKVYMKEVSYSTVTSTAWFTLISASVLVCSGSMPVIQLAIPGIWVNIPLTNNIVTTGNNLEFLVETNWASSASTGFDPDGWHNNLNPPAVGNGFPFLGYSNSIMFSHHSKSNSVQWWQQDNTPPTGGAVKSIRPNIQLTYIPSPPCTVDPTGVQVVTSSNPACYSPITLSLLNLPLMSGYSFQWYSSITSGVAGFSPVPGSTNPSYHPTQFDTTWYYCEVGCGPLPGNPSSVVMVSQNQVANCYCASGATNSTDTDIGNLQFVTINNVPGGCTPTLNNPAASGTYTDYTQTVAPPNLQQGATYPFSICQITSGNNFNPAYCNAFIDYNRDGVFDSNTERVFSGNIPSSANPTLIGNITIPYYTSLGSTRIRIVLSENSNSLQSSCGFYNAGETEDYIVNIVAGNLCTNPVIAGIAVSSATNVCCAQPFTLSITGNTTVGSGQSYQWQQTGPFCSGFFMNIPGATSPTYTTTQTVTSWYQCVITCPGGAPVVTNCVQVNSNPPSLCYCTPSLHIADCSDSHISNVTLNTLNNSSGCSGSNGLAFTVYPPVGSNTTSIAQNATYNLSVTTDSIFSQSISAWIDWNGDAIFDSLEWYGVTGNPPVVQIPGTYSIPIIIPTSSITGITGMRVRSRINTLNGPFDACTLFESGETEDYLITINPATGINEKPVTTTQSMSLYPNPVSSKVLVNYFLTHQSDAALCITDVSGKEIINLKLNNSASGSNSTMLDVSKLKDGFYLVHLTTSEASMVRHLQVIH